MHSSCKAISCIIICSWQYIFQIHKFPCHLVHPVDADINHLTSTECPDIQPVKTYVHTHKVDITLDRITQVPPELGFSETLISKSPTVSLPHKTPHSA